MIRFFRKFRQRFLNENKARKYLIYALGEILLVMIGILLALQVNNWNSNNSVRKTEKKLLLEMGNNLREDLEDIKWNIDALNRRNNDIKLIENHIGGQLKYNDSIGRAYFRLRKGITFYKNTSAYESIKSIGFNLIADDDLRTKITQLYSGRYEFIQKREDNLDSDIEINLFLPLITNNLLTNLDKKTAKPQNHEDLSKNHHFRELLKERYRRQTSLKEQFSLLEKEANEIIKTIELKYE